MLSQALPESNHITISWRIKTCWLPMFIIDENILPSGVRNHFVSADLACSFIAIILFEGSILQRLCNKNMICSLHKQLWTLKAPENCPSCSYRKIEVFEVLYVTSIKHNVIEIKPDLKNSLSCQGFRLNSEKVLPHLPEALTPRSATFW